MSTFAAEKIVNLSSITKKKPTMKKTILVVLMSVLCSGLSTAVADSVTLRIKSMRCEECAHKVNKALRSSDAVENVVFNLERRTVTIEYDGQRLTQDSIESILISTKRYKPSPYDPKEKIRRAMGLKTEEMQTAADSARVVKELWTIEGMDSVVPRMDKRYVFIRYDANKTDKATIVKRLTEAGFTPVSYYTSKVISHAYIKIPTVAATRELTEEVLALDGVDDANVNPQRGTLAITYLNDQTTAEKLEEQVAAILKEL